MALFYKTFLGRAVSLAIILLVIFYFINNFSLFFQEDSFQPVPADVEVSATSTSATSTVDVPVRLIIPSIHLDTKILAVGKTAKGNMGVPPNFTDAGWYKLGPKPGEKGNAVIDAHVDNGWGLAAVFYHLKDVHVGEELYVIDKNGATSTFKVKQMEVYDYKNAPLEKVFGPTSTHALNLITCAGTWVSSEKTNDKRLVVYTEQVL